MLSAHCWQLMSVPVSITLQYQMSDNSALKVDDTCEIVKGLCIKLSEASRWYYYKICCSLTDIKIHNIWASNGLVHDPCSFPWPLITVVQTRLFPV